MTFIYTFILKNRFLYELPLAVTIDETPSIKDFAKLLEKMIEKLVLMCLIRYLYGKRINANN